MRIHLAAAFLLLAPAAALANGYHLPTPSPRDLALAGSGTAAQNSAAAVYGNPAALAGLQGLNVAGDFGLIAIGAKWTDPTRSLGTTSTDCNGTVPISCNSVPKAAPWPALYVSYGDKVGGRNFAVGAGLSIAGGGVFFWPDDWPGRASITNVNRFSIAIDAVAAYQPIDMLKVAAGFIYYRTVEKLYQRLPVPGGRDIDVELSADGGAPSFHLAGELQPVEGFKLGIDYRHQAVQHLEGRAHFGHVPVNLNNILRDQSAKHDLTFPNVLQVGASYQVTPDFLVTAGWLLVRWVVYREDVFNGEQGLKVSVPHRYRNGFGFSLGGEYKLPAPVDGLILRLGLERLRGPQPPETMHPAIPDGSHSTITGGVGYKVMPNLEVAFGYKLAVVDTTTSVGTEAFPGEYSVVAHFMSLGATWQFGGGAK